METYFDIAGLAHYLVVSEKAIRKWVLNRSIPYRKILGVLRFRLSEIEKWVNDGCYSVLTEQSEVTDCDPLDDAVSLDELAEKELAARDEEEAGGEA
jgi:PTS system nitrogen regulatory IIA component